jgi:hypothetical protein
MGRRLTASIKTAGAERGRETTDAEVVRPRSIPDTQPPPRCAARPIASWACAVPLRATWRAPACPGSCADAVGHLVEPSVTQPVLRHGAPSEVFRLGTRAQNFLIAAMMEMPIALQLRAGWSLTERSGNVLVPRLSVPFHVRQRHCVRDPLNA